MTSLRGWEGGGGGGGGGGGEGATHVAHGIFEILGGGGGGKNTNCRPPRTPISPTGKHMVVGEEVLPV